MKSACKLVAIYAAALVASAITPAAQSQTDYPNKPVRLIIAVAPGTSTPDIVGRMAAQGIGEQLQATVIVDNKAGANGNIGMDYVAKAAPDGYTLLLNTSALVLSPWLYSKLSFDPIQDLAPITLIYTSPNVYVVNPAVPANNMREFIDYVKKNPGKLAYGSGGIGNSTHLAVELIAGRFGLNMLHVPYKSGASAVIDLVAGQVQMYSAPPTPLMSLIKSGKVRPLAVASLTRVSSMPDVPTMHETVEPGFEVGSWGGVMGPAKTPAPVMARVHSALERHFRKPEVSEKLVPMGGVLLLLPPDRYTPYIKSELERWGKVIRDAGIKPE